MSLPPRQTRPGPNLRAPSTNNHYDPTLDWRDQGIRALEQSRAAMADWKISRPSTAASLIPVIGPAWEAAADIQDGDYGSAAFNGAMAVADAFPIGQLMKLRHLAKLLSAANKGKPLSSRNFRQMRELYAKAGLIKPGQQLHHTAPLRAWKILPKADRKTLGLIRNSPALLKVMDPAAHKFAHGKKQGLDRARQVWHGSNALEKSVVGATVGKAADAGEAWTERPRPILDPKRPLDVKRTEQGFVISNRRR
jgi:hypothetical protein